MSSFESVKVLRAIPPHTGGTSAVLMPDGPMLGFNCSGQSDGSGYWNLLQSSIIMTVGDGKRWAGTRTIIAPGADYGCIGPGAIVRADKVYLFFNRWKSLTDCTVWLTTSVDGFTNWTTPIQLPTGKPYSVTSGNGLCLRNGRLLIPCSYPPNLPDMYYWRSFFMLSDDGVSWMPTGDIDYSTPQGNGCDEPAVVELASGSLLCLMRNDQGQIAKSVGTNNGSTWSTAVNSGIVSPDSPVGLTRLSWAPDRIALCRNYNSFSRYPLILERSDDGGTTWVHLLRLADGHNAAYPSMALNHEGKLFASWWDNPLPGSDLNAASLIGMDV